MAERVIFEWRAEDADDGHGPHVNWTAGHAFWMPHFVWPVIIHKRRRRGRRKATASRHSVSETLSMLERMYGELYDSEEGNT